MTVPIVQFGRDHWSTFGYIATVVVGRGGVPDKDRMRCDPSRHPGLVGPLQRGPGFAGDYSTRLRDGLVPAVIFNHDDWDCVDDLVAAGLVATDGTGVHPVLRLTDRGWAVAKTLTEHKEQGGSFSNFHV